MAITLNDNLNINAPKPIDAKYLNGVVPYISTTEANSLIDTRSIGLRVNINNEEYWYKDGVADEDLVAFSSGGGGSYTFENGLSESSGTVELGGDLTSDVIIGSNGGYAVQFGDYGAPLTSYTTAANAITTFSTGDVYDVYNGGSTTISYTQSLNSLDFSNFTDTNFNSGDVSFNNNDVSINSTTLSVNTESTFTGHINAYQNIVGPPSSTTLNLENGLITDDRGTKTGFTYADDYSTDFTDRSLVDKAYVDSVAGGGSSYDASNGINLDGTTFKLGGNLNTTTNIGGLNIYDLTFNDIPVLTVSGAGTQFAIGSSGTPISQLQVEAESIYLNTPDLTLRGTTDLNIQAESATITMLSGNTGIEYAADYSSSYTSRSLVDKAYVDANIGSGTVTLANGSGTTAIAGTAGINLGGTTTAAVSIVPSSSGAHGFSLGSTSVPYTTIGKTAQTVFNRGMFSSSFYSEVRSIYDGTSACRTTILSRDSTNGYSQGIFNAGNGGNYLTSLESRYGTSAKWGRISISSNSPLTDSYISISAQTASSNTVSIDINTGATNTTGLLSITGGSTSFAGAQYAADYSANFTSLSLVSKNYVDTGLSGKQASLGYTPEDIALKSTSTSLGTSNTLYPTQNAVKTYVDTAIAGVGGGGGTSYTFVNGLTATAGTAGLGGTLNANTTIDLSTYDLKFSSDSVQYSADYSGTYVSRSLVDKAYVDAAIVTFNNTTTIASLSSTTTIDATYANKTIECTGTFTLTLPNSMATGMRLTVVNISTGVITMAASTTLNTKGSYKKLASQWSAATFYHRGSNVWVGFGDFTP